MSKPIERSLEEILARVGAKKHEPIVVVAGGVWQDELVDLELVARDKRRVLVTTKDKL